MSKKQRTPRVIDLPPDLRGLEADERGAIEKFLAWARRQGAHEAYVARHRRAWWSVALRDPAPILCTYMARRAPAFVRNQVKVRHINIAHGLYPREPLAKDDLMAIVTYLRRHIGTAGGRVYAGGLVKFEPRELERILVPRVGDIHGHLAESEVVTEKIASTSGTKVFTCRSGVRPLTVYQGTELDSQPTHIRSVAAPRRATRAR
jgi:hypothetical protein